MSTQLYNSCNNFRSAMKTTARPIVSSMYNIVPSLEEIEALGGHNSQDEEEIIKRNVQDLLNKNMFMQNGKDAKVFFYSDCYSLSLNSWNFFSLFLFLFLIRERQIT